MAVDINECIINIYHVVRRYYDYKIIWNAFVEEVLVCEQGTQIKTEAFIQGWSL